VSLGLIIRLGILAGSVAGCAAAALPAAMQLIPAGAEAIGVVGGTLANHSSSGDLRPGEDEADRRERCDNLVEFAPTVIELRRTAAAAPQWRELQIANGSDRRWVPATASDGAGTWRPTTNLLAMNFAPPLVLPSEVNVSTYLGYAPSEPLNSSEQDALTGLIANFGAPVGTFLWNGRIYQYATAAKLPCFPPAVAMK
jgi:hypothetical protein